MSGELAELIALVAHGNAYLCGLRQAAKLTRSNSTFQYVESVRFVRRSRLRRAATVATTTADWFQALESSGAKRISLVARADADRNLVGLANAGTGAMLVHLQGASDVWTGTWSVTSPRAPDDRIWSVVYEGRRALRGARAPSVDVSAARERLRDVLTEAEFLAAGKRGLGGFASWFGDARRLLDDPDPTPPYHPDLLPDVGYTLAARQLLASAARAWVFGGMGSWNDVYLEDERSRTEYERVSGDLWHAVLNGLCGAVNAFEPRHEP